MTGWLSTLWIALFLSNGFDQRKPAERVGIGVVGDSYSDEYQFYPVDRRCARNWVEILAEHRGLNFGPFCESSRGEPRNQGYAYNWARADATTKSMLEQGQHLGVAQQVREGQVQVVVVVIGGNDLINAVVSYDCLEALRKLPDSAGQNLRRCVDTILAANPKVRVILGTIPDIRELPDIQKLALCDTVCRALIRATDEFNTAIRRIAATDERITVIDLHQATEVSRIAFPKAIPVAGHVVVREGSGNDCDHLFLADDRHLGSIGQGLFANQIVSALQRIQIALEPLSDEELVRMPAMASKKETAPNRLTAMP